MIRSGTRQNYLIFRGVRDKGGRCCCCCSVGLVLVMARSSYRFAQRMGRGFHGGRSQLLHQVSTETPIIVNSSVFDHLNYVLKREFRAVGQRHATFRDPTGKKSETNCPPLQCEWRVPCRTGGKLLKFSSHPPCRTSTLSVR